MSTWKIGEKREKINLHKLFSFIKMINSRINIISWQMSLFVMSLMEKLDGFSRGTWVRFNLCNGVGGKKTKLKVVTRCPCIIENSKLYCLSLNVMEWSSYQVRDIMYFYVFDRNSNLTNYN